MFPPGTCEHRLAQGHQSLHVITAGLGGATDEDVLRYASSESRVVVTENAADFVPLLDTVTASGDVPPPVVVALKRTLPTTAGAMARRLAQRLARWAAANPDPYPHVHWLG